MLVHHIGAGAGTREGSGTSPAGLDGTAQADDRDLRSVPPESSRKVGAWLVAGRVEQFLGFRSPFGECLGVGLVAVADLVDEAHFLGPFRHHRGAVDGFPHGLQCRSSAPGDDRHGVVHGGLGQTVGHLPVGLGDLGRRELIRCGLVLVTLSELRGDPGLLQQPAEEGDVDLDAADAEYAGGLEPDGATCRGEFVGGQGVAEFPERLGPRHGRPSRPEGLDQVGDLVHHRHRLTAVHGVNDQPGDTLILDRFREVSAKVADRSRAHRLKHL